MGIDPDDPIAREASAMGRLLNSSGCLVAVIGMAIVIGGTLVVYVVTR